MKDKHTVARGHSLVSSLYDGSERRTAYWIQKLLLDAESDGYREDELKKSATVWCEIDLDIITLMVCVL